MKCPNCGKDMVLGAVFHAKGDTRLNWVPKEFLDKHWFNSYCHTKRTIENQGGIVMRGYRKFGTSDTCYGCKACRFVVIDCSQS